MPASRAKFVKAGRTARCPAVRRRCRRERLLMIKDVQAARPGPDSPGMRAREGITRLMTASRDVVIVGGGHNGLVAAAYLARSGLDCWSASGATWSAARRSASTRSAPDYTVTSLSYVVSLLPAGPGSRSAAGQPRVPRFPAGPLFRAARGWPVPAAAARAGGSGSAEIAKFSARDAAAYDRLRGAPGQHWRDPRADAGGDPAAARVAAAAGPAAAGAAAAASAQARYPGRGRCHPAAHRQHRRPGRAATSRATPCAGCWPSPA